MMKYLKNFSLLFLIFIISKTFSANANNVYFINSTANNLTEVDQHSLKNFLDKESLNLINYTKNINSIFDQADIYEEISQQNTNKKKRITYNQVFHPLINILHKRLLNSYFDYYDQNLLLIFNNINNDTLLRNYFTNNSFLFKNNKFCIVEFLDQIESCIDEFVSK